MVVLLLGERLSRGGIALHQHQRVQTLHVTLPVLIVAAGQQGDQNQQSGYALTIATSGSGSATVTHDGNAVTSGSTLNEDDEVEISITPAEGQVPTASINSSAIELTEDNGVYTGSFAMPGQASALVISTGVSGEGGDGGDGLDKD